MPAPPKLLKTLPNELQLCQIRFSPDGTSLAAGSFVGTVVRWDSSGENWKPLSPLTGHDGWVQSVCFHPDPKKPTLFSADSWGRIMAWDTSVAEPKPRWNVKDAHDGWIYKIATSLDGEILASVGRDRTIRLTSVSDGKEIARLNDHREPVQTIAFHPDGKQFLTGDLKGIVKQWHLESRKVVREFDAKSMFLRDRIQDVGGVRCLGFDAKGETLFVGGSVPKTGGFVQGLTQLLSFSWADGKLIKDFRSAADSDGYLYEVEWHPDGFLMGVSSGQPGQGKLLFWKRGEEKPYFTGAGMANCHSLALHPVSKKLVVLAANANSAGNGRQLGKAKDYPGNSSPFHLWDVPKG